MPLIMHIICPQLWSHHRHLRHHGDSVSFSFFFPLSRAQLHDEVLDRFCEFFLIGWLLLKWCLFWVAIAKGISLSEWRLLQNGTWFGSPLLGGLLAVLS